MQKDPHLEEGATATEEVFQRVYSELRSLAASYLRSERPDHTLHPTALVHEAYLRLASMSPGRWENKGKFVAVAARAMRRILIDHARAKRTRKRHAQTVSLAPGTIAAAQTEVDLLGLDEALRALSEKDKQRGQIVELHFFGGLTVNETAQTLGIGERTVYRQLRSAKAWLKLQLHPDSLPGRSSLS